MIKLRKIFTALLCVVFSQSLFGQKISNIDFDEIKLAIQDSSSNYYYPLLIERFSRNDSTLSRKEYEYIYYGSCYCDNYNPYEESENEIKFIGLYNNKKYEEAINYGLEALKENPVNLRLLFKMLVCYDVLEDKQSAQKYADMYFPLLKAIYDSGDGKSINTAYVVINVIDEYEILADLGLNRSSQALLEESVDLLRVYKDDEKPEEGQEVIEESLYFNVSKPLASLQKLFEDKE